MSLYLCIFDQNGVELEGVEVGPYVAYDEFRQTVLEHVEEGAQGEICPTLMLSSDSEGEWSPADAALLIKELKTVEEKFRSLPPVELEVGWKRMLWLGENLPMGSLYDCFFDVDGEPLISRLSFLAQKSVDTQLNIQFQ